MKLLASLICWLRGHRWVALRECEHRTHLTHLNALAGALAWCERCETAHHDECMSCSLRPRTAAIAAKVGW